MPQARLPVIERIARKMVKRLQDFGTVAAGCQHDFKVQRWAVSGNVPKAPDVAPGKAFAVFTQPPAQPLTEDNFNKNWLQPFWLYVYVNADESNDESFDSRINAAVADVTRVLCNEEVFTWEGLAKDTTLGTPQQFPNGRAYGIRVEINVQYSHVSYDPCQHVNDT